MGKDKTTKQAGAGKGKKPKVPELEDFFTIALGKKNRNIEKKLKHAQELVDKCKSDKVELTTAQSELVARKPELLQQIQANNDLKAMYIDAWMKREEEPKVATETVVETVAVDETEIENRGVRKALNAVTKLMLVSDLLRNQECCNKFSALSGLANLESVLEFTSQNCRCNGENTNRWTASQDLLFNFVARTPVATSSGKPLVELCDLVDSVVNSAHFDKFVPAEEKPVSVPEPVQESPKKMSEHAVVMTRSRKESEAQQDVFMAEDDDSEDEEMVVVPTHAQRGADVKVTETKPKDSQAEAAKEPRAPKKQVEKAPAKRKGEFGGDLDSDDEEWIQNTRTAKPYGGERGRGERGRGGRGRGGDRGGRGHYRGKDGERLERGPRKEGEEGERKPWTKDGYRPRGDGERGGRDGERGGRGRGERGRGGYKGKKPWTTGEGGERRNFTKTNEGDKPQAGEGQAPLKEIGTNEQAPAKVEAPKQE